MTGWCDSLSIDVAHHLWSPNAVPVWRTGAKIQRPCWLKITPHPIQLTVHWAVHVWLDISYTYKVAVDSHKINVRFAPEVTSSPTYIIEEILLSIYIHYENKKPRHFVILMVLFYVTLLQSIPSVVWSRAVIRLLGEPLQEYILRVATHAACLYSW